MRKGKELKAPYYTSAMALCNNYVTIYNIIPNNITYNKNNNDNLNSISVGITKDTYSSRPES